MNDSFLSLVEETKKELIQNIKEMDKKLNYKVTDDTESKYSESVSIDSEPHTNVVDSKKLRSIQSATLRMLRNNLSKTFGPMGSNTKIITGNSNNTISSTYSKDGLKVLGKIVSSGPIEMSIIEEIIEATRYVESQVGDGTTSTVILSSLIFDNLIKIGDKYNIAPYQLIRDFKSIVEEIKESILNNVRRCTLDEIYNISMVSTNGNEEVSRNIQNIYKEHGLDVDLSVGISNTSDSILKVYDGLTLTEGMSDPVFINNPTTGECEIHNAKVYHFADPIDTMDMIVLFESILNHNLYETIENEEAPIPTVITCPRISKDMSGILKQLSQMLYQYDNNNMKTSKPPIMIITNVVGSDEAIMDDIATLCGCKSIRRYIDPKMLARDQESGIAPTVENVFEFGGDCELVSANSSKTKFINPIHMRIYKEDGSNELDPKCISLINFLETEIKNAKPTETANTIGLLKRRLSSLKSNMVEYLIGGITILDRDNLKDLVEDAVKNCKSAAENGIGYAANYEGLIASYECFMNKMKEKQDEYKISIAFSIFDAYFKIAEILYSTVEKDPNRARNIVMSSIFDYKKPYNISKGYSPCIESDVDDPNDFVVNCSIMTDVKILDTLSRIITIMVTCNQCLVQSPSLNNYC